MASLHGMDPMIDGKENVCRLAELISSCFQPHATLDNIYLQKVYIIYGATQQLAPLSLLCIILCTSTDLTLGCMRLSTTSD